MDLEELYSEMIIDHNNHPKNFGTIKGATHRCEGYNPVCGDRYTVYAKIKNGTVQDISFTGEGCAISKSSASIMTDIVKNRKTEDAKKIFDLFQKIISNKKTTHCNEDDLLIFSGISQFPGRVKCASLPWHTLMGVITGSQITTTEEDAITN